MKPNPELVNERWKILQFLGSNDFLVTPSKLQENTLGVYYYTSNQPKSPNVPYVIHMNPLTYKAKFEVMQPSHVLATKTTILYPLSIKIE